VPADQRPAGGETTSRRSVLAAVLGLPAGALLAGSLSGCDLRLGQPDGRPVAPAADLDLLARERVADAAVELARAARLTARIAPDAAHQLAEIAADHEAHASALRPVPAAGAGSATAGSPTARATTSPTAGSSQAPAPTPQAALAQRAAAERSGVVVVEQELTAVSGGLARLLASVAADRALHAETLGALAVRNRR